MKKVKVLFVCLGNICRSPTAHAVFENLLRANGYQKQVVVDSCGTAGYHIGEIPDSRSMSAARGRGVEMNHLRGRQLQAHDFETFDYILAMDKQNLKDILIKKPEGSECQIKLFLSYDKQFSEDEVPDPYYGGDNGFEHVLDLIESASDGLLHEILLKSKG